MSSHTHADVTANVLAPMLTPHGRLLIQHDREGTPLAPDLADRLQTSFARGAGHGLLQLAAGEVGAVLPPVFGYWRDFASRYVTAVCTLPHLGEPGAKNSLPVPPPVELESFAAAAPPMIGAEYVTADVLHALWGELERAFQAELSASNASIQEFLKSRNPAWNLVGRVHFNLAENRKDEAAPFAFLATYTTRLSAQATAQHLPLAQALREYAGAANRQKLLSLLLPVQRAAEQCSWLKAMVDAGEIYHPLRWSPPEAFKLLTDLPLLESSGVVVRVPGNWKGNRPPRPQVSATVGGQAPSGLSMDALLDFRMEVTLEGEPLDGQGGCGFAGRFRGPRADPRTLGRGGPREARPACSLTFVAWSRHRPMAESVSLKLCACSLAQALRATRRLPVSIPIGPGRRRTLARANTQGAAQSRGLARVDPGNKLKTDLRPYQQIGVRWLYLLAKLGVGACLADDMGLGKTIQVLSLLLVLRARRQRLRGPHQSCWSRPRPCLRTGRRKSSASHRA